MTTQFRHNELIKTEYVGDGVYAGSDGFQIWLYTLSGDRIALDERTFKNLIEYASKKGPYSNQIPEGMKQ